MHNRTATYRAAALLLAASTVSVLLAVDTHVWEQSDQAEFARGTPKHISIRSDGRLTLAPRFQELDSTSLPYLWAVAQDSKGGIYYAGGAPTGTTAKIFVLPPHGKSKLFAELPGLEIHSLAIDSEDRLYAAVLPDAKIYRVGKSGKSELFFDAKCKYIWAMAFDRTGNLFVATGDSGIVYRVTPAGTSAEFVRTGETHARSMIIDRAGNLIIGTDPGGLILRVTPKGESFVLYQADKREITAVAEHDGLIYASAIGSKPVSVSGPAPVLPSAPPAIAPTGAPRTGTTPPMLPPAVGSLSAAVSGGSDLYRIQKDGFTEKIWSSPSDIVYSIAFDAKSRALLATGNKGLIYRVDSDQVSTELLNAAPTQVTALLQARNGIIYAVTGNVGNLYSIGPSLESSGTLESDVLDVNDFAYWGKVHLSSTLHRGAIGFETRSGNLSRPQSNWSPWTKVPVSELGGQIESPPARFLQYRLTFTASETHESPELSVVDIAYLPRNAAPKVHQVEIEPFNYSEAPSSGLLERTVMPSGSAGTMTVPAVGQKRSTAVAATESAAPAATLQYRKGYVTLRWSADDPNGDVLAFNVELRGKNETYWRTLKKNLEDRFYSFDSAAFPDGQYVVRITASDAPSNPPAAALSASFVSEPFTIDNTPPEIVNPKVACTSGACQIGFTARDALSWIDKAEYSVDGGEWTVLNPVSKVTDSQMLDYRLEVTGRHMVAIRVFDEDDNVTVRQFPLQ